MAKRLKLPGEALPTIETARYLQLSLLTHQDDGFPLMLQVQPRAVAFKWFTSLFAIRNPVH